MKMQFKKKIWIVSSIVISLLLLIVVIAFFMSLQYFGTWNMYGYGLCFKMQGPRVKAYQVTDTTYARIKEYDGILVGNTLYSGLGVLKLSITEDGNLHIIDEGSSVTYMLDKKDATFFKEKIRVTKDRPDILFQMFYECFKDYYPFARKYDVDFDQIYQELQKEVTRNTNMEELYRVFCRFVDGLQDGHVSISFEEEVYMPYNYIPEWISDKEKQRVVAGVITNNYVKDYYKFKDCLIRYGSLREDIGYIIMQGQGVEALNKTKTTKRAMEQILSTLKDKPRIVIDLRFNGGGFDEASLLLSGYFTKEPYLAYKKGAYDHGDIMPMQSIYVYPNELQYEGDLILLTSGYTISAAETFIQALKANSKREIIVLGEETAGFYSDAFEKYLPGGISFTMSMEQYTTWNDIELEGNGIVPDVFLPINIEEAVKGKDLAFDYILNHYERLDSE